MFGSAPRVHSAQGGQGNVSDPLEQELQMVESYHEGAEN